MDKMTHVKFNFNNFLMGISGALNNIEDNNRFDVSYESKRVAYIALKLTNYMNFEPEHFSDMFSYSVLYLFVHDKSDLERLPFIDSNIYTNESYEEIIQLAIEIEKNLEVKNNFIMNKSLIKDIVLGNKSYSDSLKESFDDLSTDMTFWLDLMQDCQLPFFIYNFLQDFTIEISYEKLIELSEVINKIVYNYTDNQNASTIGIKCKSICEVYSMDDKDTSRMVLASNFHSLGKLFVSKEVFLKNTKLNDIEYDSIKSIPYFTASILKQIFGFDDIAKLCSTYAEKLDGSGYPYELEASYLSLKDRILSILVIYQALVEQRVYRKKYTHNEAIQILRDEAKLGKIDKTIVEDFDKHFKK